MNEYDVHEAIFKQVCKEISLIADQIQKKGSMTESDLERLDKLYHVKKDMLTAEAMMESKEYENGMSGARGRSPITGRYISRESGNSYADGYNQGYSQAMNQMMNGNSNAMHPQMPNYSEPRRW